MSDSATPTKPAPVPTDVSQGYWAAFQEGTLVAQYCPQCSRLQHYPKPVCGGCWSSELEWRPLAGTGTVYTFGIVHRGPSREFSDTPYVVALIDLDEGVRMMSSIATDDPGALRIGDRVRVKAEQRGDTAIPVFEPI